MHKLESLEESIVWDCGKAVKRWSVFFSQLYSAALQVLLFVLFLVFIFKEDVSAKYSEARYSDKAWRLIHQCLPSWVFLAWKVICLALRFAIFTVSSFKFKVTNSINNILSFNFSIFSMYLGMTHGLIQSIQFSPNLVLMISAW